LKWNIESCRRSLLAGMLSYVHKQDKFKQLKSENQSLMENANQTQLKGYTMLISAKLPLILNINRYINITYNSYKETIKPEIEVLFNDWTALIEAIKENISKLEESIEQSSMDSLLLEQQEMRSEQETITEIERVRQKKGNEDSGSNAIGLTNNHIAMMALIAAFFLFAKFVEYEDENDINSKLDNGKEIHVLVSRFFAPIIKDWLFSHNDGPTILFSFMPLVTILSLVLWGEKILSFPVIQAAFSKLEEGWNSFPKTRKRAIIPFLFFSAIFVNKFFYSINIQAPKLGGNNLIVISQLSIAVAIVGVIYWSSLFLEQIRRKLNEDIPKYQYEITVRIQAPLDDTKFIALLKNTNISSSMNLDSYRAEYFNDNEVHHKIFFDTGIPVPNKNNNEIIKLDSHITYDIIKQIRGKDPITNQPKYTYFFNEFRVVCLSNIKLTSDNIEWVEECMQYNFINIYLDPNHPVENICNLSIFKIS
jgi:hypothetical protein